MRHDSSDRERVALVPLVAAWLIAAPASARTVLLGRSWQGRPIRAVEVGNPFGTRVLVVGCIHGNETAGITIAHALERVAPSDLDLWIVPDLNPDGVAADTRQNAHGVDLNRNFPWRWRPMGGVYESGPRPLSEREARIGHALILRLRPHLSVKRTDADQRGQIKVRYFYAWTPLVIVGTVVLLSLTWLGLIALMVVSLAALAALTWAIVWVPLMVSRAISRHWQGRSGTSPRTGGGPVAGHLGCSTDSISADGRDGAPRQPAVRKEHVT